MNLVKLGGSVLTVKRDEPSLRRDVLERLAGELEGTGPLALVHGAGSFGHPQAREAFDGGLDAMGLARTHRSVTELNRHVVDALHEREVPAVGLAANALARTRDGEIVRFEAEPFRYALEGGMVPVTHGDVVADETRGFAVLSGDVLVARLARELDVDRVVFVTDVDGIHTRDPKVSDDAELVEEVGPDDAIEVTGARTVDVTGGMEAKLEAMRDVAATCDVWVVNGLEPGRLAEVLKGGKVLGTRVRRR